MGLFLLTRKRSKSCLAASRGEFRAFQPGLVGQGPPKGQRVEAAMACAWSGQTMRISNPELRPIWYIASRN